METHKTYTLSEASEKLKSYCAYRERCHKEVETKLTNMRMIPEARAQIVHVLLQEGFLNEERFAQSFARGKFRIKKWGKNRIIRELKAREISKYNIETALKEIDQTDYLQTLDEIAKKKLNLIPDKNPFKKRKKLVNHLMYKGFEPDMIYDKANELIPW